MSEQKSYKVFRAGIKAPRDRIQRIENVMVIGMPDVNCCLRDVVGGKEFWVEIKSPKEPKRESTPLFGSNHKVSQEQKNWFLEQRNAGGKAYLMIETDKRWLLIGSSYVDGVNEMTVPRLIEVALWHATKPTRKEKWDTLKALLLRR